MINCLIKLKKPTVGIFIKKEIEMARKNNPKQTRENIVSVSTKLFIEKGYDGTSMQDIINALGMSKGAIFYHFKSKEEIFNAAMESQFSQVTDEVNKWILEMNGLTASEKLKGLIKRNLTDETVNDSSNIIASATGSSQIILASIQNSIRKLSPIITNIIKEGIEDGSVKTEFPNECADVFLLLLNFWCDTDVFPGDMDVLIKRFRFLQHLMKQLGLDIIEDEIIEAVKGFYQRDPLK